MELARRLPSTRRGTYRAATSGLRHFAGRRAERSRQWDLTEPTAESEVYVKHQVADRIHLSTRRSNVPMSRR